MLFLFEHFPKVRFADYRDAKALGLVQLAAGLFTCQHKAGFFAHASCGPAAVPRDQRLGLITAQGGKLRDHCEMRHIDRRERELSDTV